MGSKEKVKKIYNLTKLQTQEALDFDPNQNIGNNKIWCKNRFISGNQYYHIFYSLILLTIPFSVFLSINIKVKNKNI